MLWTLDVCRRSKIPTRSEKEATQNKEGKTSFQIMKSEVMRINHELQAQKEKIKENAEKIKVNKTLPYLVSNVIEVRLVTLCWVTFSGHDKFCAIVEVAQFSCSKQ